MWTMWGVLCLPGQGDARIYGIYTSLNQAIKAIIGTDNSYEYTFEEKEDSMLVTAVSKFNPNLQTSYIIKEYKIDV